MSYEILKTIDFIDGRVDTESIHPTRLQKLVKDRLIDEVNPGDGESCFYILSVAGAELLAAGYFGENRGPYIKVKAVDEISPWNQLNLN